MPKPPTGMFRRGQSWYVRLHRGGRDRWVSLGQEYGLAVDRLRALRSADLPPARLLVRDVAETWLQSHVATARRPKDCRLARRRVEMYLIPALGDLYTTHLTRDHLRQYRLWLEGRDLAPQSVAHILADCRCLLRWAEDSGYIDRAPIPRRLLPRIPERPPDRLTDEDAASIATIPDPYGFVCRLGLSTGLRWGELCRAQAADLREGMLLVGQSKSGRVRRVPVPPALAAEIRGRVGRLCQFASAGNFARSVRRLSRVSAFHCHQMRHTFACQWLERGGSLPALQQILGHSSIRTTQRYAKLGEDAIRHEAMRVHSVAPIVARDA